MAVQAWHAQVKRADQLFNSLTDAQLLEQVAPNRNRGVYLLGHLTATHDAMLDLFGLGKRLHPGLDEAFLTNPDKADLATPAVSDLRSHWSEVNQVLANHFTAMTTDAWFQRHTRVSEEDFAREPHRNKLNVLLSRTSHVAYHLGQLVFLKR